MVGSFVAATVVSLLQFMRLRDKRFLLLAALFACQAQALGREWWDGWKDVYQAGACAAGLGLVLALSPRTRREEAAEGPRDHVVSPAANGRATQTPS